MEITFKNKKLHQICHSKSHKELKKVYGKNCARKISSRLDDLQAAANLEAMRLLAGRCHELKGDRKGQLSLDLEHPLRLIFEPSNEDVKMKENGGLDWNSVKAVRIIDVEDTHE